MPKPPNYQSLYTGPTRPVFANRSSGHSCRGAKNLNEMPKVDIHDQRIVELVKFMARVAAKNDYTELKKMKVEAIPETLPVSLPKRPQP